MNFLKFFIILAFCFLLGGAMYKVPGWCLTMDSKAATEVLKSAGYTDINFFGYDWLSGCHGPEFLNVGFVARGPTGQRTVGCVCESWFTGSSTIRIK